MPFLRRTDQIGVLAGAIDNFREALNEIKNENERKAREQVIIEEMFASITEVVDSLEGRARQMVTTADSLEALAGSTEQQSESVTQHASESAEHTNKVSESTARLQAALSDINTQIVQQACIVTIILETNNRSQEHITGLNDSIKQINNIISMVEDLTDQTNLLALNATIEAARAGELGRGFAVVAGEVKELSLKTDRATDEVMSKVKAIEKASEVLLSNLSRIDTQLQQLSQATGNITQAVDQQRNETVHIAGLASRTSENTRTVSRSILEVSDAAAQTRRLAGEVHLFSDEIASRLTGLLNDAALRIKQIADFQVTEKN